jgi:hypothetical protein
MTELVLGKYEKLALYLYHSERGEKKNLIYFNTEKK